MSLRPADQGGGLAIAPFAVVRLLPGLLRRLGPGPGRPRFAQPGPGRPCTRVAVLGSIHLCALPRHFDLQPLQPRLDRLAALDPQVIAVEARSGESCDRLRRHRPLIEGADDTCCPETEAARRATGSELPAEVAEMRRRYAVWPARPTPAQRRGLAAVLPAAGERAPALAQWLQLPAAQRRAGDGLDAALAAQLRTLADTARNGSSAVGAALAARLACSVSTRSTTTAPTGCSPTWGRGTRPRSARSAGGRPPLPRALAGLARPRRPVTFPQRQRSPAGRIASDLGAVLRDASAERYGRQYAAWREARNLRTAANLREAFGNRPGVRVLNIVGATHKPCLDACLGRMRDPDAVGVGALLAPGTR